MDEDEKKYLGLLNIQIGCILKLNRLSKDISQHYLAASIDSTSTTIGRIERAEVMSGWDKIYILSQELNIDFNTLFLPLPQSELLLIVDEIFKLDQKLNKEKKEYYRKLKATIKSKYDSLKK
jgi:transcriptional regulator with XRE-family HTH domain